MLWQAMSWNWPECWMWDGNDLEVTQICGQGLECCDRSLEVTNAVTGACCRWQMLRQGPGSCLWLSLVVWCHSAVTYGGLGGEALIISGDNLTQAHNASSAAPIITTSAPTIALGSYYTFHISPKSSNWKCLKHTNCRLMSVFAEISQTLCHFSNISGFFWAIGKPKYPLDPTVLHKIQCRFPILILK